MMTKKDFEAIAEAIRESNGQATTILVEDGGWERYLSETDLINRLNRVFLASNPHFDGAKFHEAVRGAK